MKKYLPFILIDIKANRRIIFLFEMLFWPVMSLLSLAIFSRFVGLTGQAKNFLFTGMISWSCIYLSFRAISVGFLQEIFHKSSKQTFSAPITLTDCVIGHWLYGILQISIAFFLLGFFSTFFGFNIFDMGFYIPLAIGLMALTGFFIGTIAVSFVLWLGLRVDFLVWALVDMVVFISGVYYSITVFPVFIQIISRFFPVVYILEGMRGALAGNVVLQTFATGYLVAFVWIIILFILLRKIENYAKRTGFYQKYG